MTEDIEILAPPDKLPDLPEDNLYSLYQEVKLFWGDVAAEVWWNKVHESQRKDTS